MANFSPVLEASPAAMVPQDSTADRDYWFSLIPENPAAKFLNLKCRSLQGFRYRGGGPKYVLISSRCIRYRRIDLWEWAKARLRSSTSDTGQASV